MAICGKCHRDVPDGALFCSFCGESIKPPTLSGSEVDPLIGQTLGGKYLIHELLGRGGMGDVYKATHLTLDRPVVLKLLKKQFNSDQSLVQRFHREARAASRLNHPNSITIIDFGQTDDSTLFMAMEYLAGKSLERIIAEEKAVAEPRAIHMGAQILAALAEAHALGIIHRDLKPANVMIEPRRDEPDHVKVLDFGIAKLNEPGEGGAGLTQAGVVCGTPGYMSTEQVRGEELDARSDLYAVGVILYEMLTGVLPFESDTPMGLVTKHLVEDPPPLSVRRPGTAVTPELESVIMTALARDRAERFASAEEMRGALLACAPAGAYAVRSTPAPMSTMIFDQGAMPPAPVQRPVTGSGRQSGSAIRAPSGPFPKASTPTGSRRAGTGPRPAAATPAPARAGTPAPEQVPAMDEGRGGEPAARSKKTAIIAAAGVGGAVAIGLVVFLATRGPSKVEASPATAPAAPATAQPPAPAPAAPEPPPAAAAPAPAAQPPAAPVPEPKAEPPEPELGMKLEPMAHRPGGKQSKGIRQVGEDLNSIKTPPESSGDGVLTVSATPWAEVFIDGRSIGETPREVRLGHGSYRVRATHPALGKREQTVTIKAGKRQTWSPTFAN